jgi:Tol biopolymer transport system component
MTPRKWAVCVVSLSSALLVACRSASLVTTATSYSAAFLNNGQLTVFPWAGSVVSMPVRAGLGVSRYSRDGTSLYTSYTSADSNRSEIQKIDIRTGRAARWLGIPGFTSVVSFALTQDESRVVISGRYRDATELVCGVYEVQPGNGKIPRLLLRESGSTCDINRSWFNISLSPDGKLAVAWEGRRLVVDLIDLDSGTSKSIGHGAIDSWSPDGKWIAVLDTSPRREHVLLLDASNPSKSRDLGPTDGETLAWSPDSRSLLLWNVELRCLPVGFGYWGSLEVADIQSGERTVIQSSRCKVNNSTGGWVSNSAWK